ncbi:MAG: hypothetical protein ACLFM7_06500 [Bacteroidales bacterium]
MSTPLKQFLLQQLYLTIGVYILGFIAFRFIFPQYYNVFFLFLPLIIYFVMGAFHGFLLAASRLPERRFSSRFLAVLGAKIFLLLIFIIAFSYLNPHIAVPFLISFFILYIIYTAFEITSLLQYLRGKRRNS